MNLHCYLRTLTLTKQTVPKHPHCVREWLDYILAAILCRLWRGGYSRDLRQNFTGYPQGYLYTSSTCIYS